MRRTAIALTMIGTVLWFTAASAMAQNYGTPSLLASNPTPAPGETITVSGTGCPSNFEVNLFFDGDPVAETVSDSNGAFSSELTIPSDAAFGNHTITAVCDEEVLNLTITVAPPGSGTVATTGANSTIPLTRIGLALVAVGGFVVLLARRRRVAEHV